MVGHNRSHESQGDTPIHLFITVLTIGFVAPSYSGSEGGSVQPVVSIILGMLSAGLTVSVRFSTVDGVAVGKLCVRVCKCFSC